jgi:hypothetical protein
MWPYSRYGSGAEPAVRSGQMHALFVGGRAMEASVAQAGGQEADEA